jgi:HAD superfamily hydrolase (TIGR01549 family)
MNLSREQIRAITFDAYGTLLRLDRPFERLEEELNRIDLHVPMEIVTKVFLREMAYYREHHLEGNNPENLLSLRLRCADLLFRMLAQEGYEAQVAREDRLRVLMGSIRFKLYADALPALVWCTANGFATGVISAWDCSLVATLKEHCPHAFSQVIVSAIEGIDKSEPGLFLKAAQSFSIPPWQIIHIGDEVENDIFGAEKAGMKAVLIDRDKAHNGIKSHRIESLEDFPKLFA